MANKLTKITRNGQAVDCYGEYRLDSNVYCCFDDFEYDGVFFPDSDELPSWTSVVEHLTAYAKREGIELVELQAI